MNEIRNAILTRRSVRSYKPDPVPQDVLERILTAGQYAATGMNRQSPIILAVTNKAMRDKLSAMNAEIMGSSGDPFYGAPVVLVVLANKAAPTYLYDGSLVMGNLMLAAHAEGRNWCVLPIGKKALEHYRRRGVPVVTDRYAVAADVEMSGCYDIARTLAKGFVNGEFDEVILAYTNFVSMLSQQPATLRLLPLNYEPAEKGSGPRQTTLYEPDCETVYNAIVPEYLAGLIWGGLCESVASELGARRTAMDAASKNAGEMIETLSLHYNRARQAAITQEITEIVAGAEG